MKSFLIFLGLCRDKTAESSGYKNLINSNRPQIYIFSQIPTQNYFLCLPHIVLFRSQLIFSNTDEAQMVRPDFFNMNLYETETLWMCVTLKRFTSIQTSSYPICLFCFIILITLMEVDLRTKILLSLLSNLNVDEQDES